MLFSLPAKLEGSAGRDILTTRCKLRNLLEGEHLEAPTVEVAVESARRDAHSARAGRGVIINGGQRVLRLPREQCIILRKEMIEARTGSDLDDRRKGEAVGVLCTAAEERDPLEDTGLKCSGIDSNGGHEGRGHGLSPIKG